MVAPMTTALLVLAVMVLVLRVAGALSDSQSQERMIFNGAESFVVLALAACAGINFFL